MQPSKAEKEEEPKEEKPKRKRRTKAEIAADEAKKEAEKSEGSEEESGGSEEESGGSEEESGGSEEISLDEVRALLGAKVDAKNNPSHLENREKAMKKIKTYTDKAGEKGCKSVGSLNPKHYAEFVQFLEELD
jgi:hypothetical protein